MPAMLPLKAMWSATATRISCECGGQSLTTCHSAAAWHALPCRTGTVRLPGVGPSPCMHHTRHSQCAPSCRARQGASNACEVFQASALACRHTCARLAHRQLGNAAAPDLNKMQTGVMMRTARLQLCKPSFVSDKDLLSSSMVCTAAEAGHRSAMGFNACTPHVACTELLLQTWCHCASMLCGTAARACILALGSSICQAAAGMAHPPDFALQLGKPVCEGQSCIWIATSAAWHALLIGVGTDVALL